MKGKYLITTDAWFFAPDGQNYRSIWGDVKIVEDSILGIKTNRNSSNWYLQIGSNENHVIVAGCQIHYAIRCDNKPKLKPFISEDFYEGKLVQSHTNSQIYIAE
jgi:hypothetical protein